MGHESRRKSAEKASPDTHRRIAFDRIKKATVAVAVLHDKAKEPSKDQPYTVIGSGFCVHRRGVVVTCTHVMDGFLEKPIQQQVAEIPEEEKKKSAQTLAKIKAVIPYALFFIPRPNTHQVEVACVGAQFVISSTEFDITVFRLSPHDSFAKTGFPAIEFAEFESLHEGMPIGTCGFPTGNVLFQQLGTLSSSFSQGIISSIIPAAGIARKHVKGFQLDLRATYGNSGGPVYSSETGKVFGVLSGGINDQHDNFLFSHAESIYRLIDTKMVDSVLNAPAHFPHK